MNNNWTLIDERCSTRCAESSERKVGVLCVYVCISVSALNNVRMYVCRHVCMYVCMYVCRHVLICERENKLKVFALELKADSKHKGMYFHTYIHTYIWSLPYLNR